MEKFYGRVIAILLDKYIIEINDNFIEANLRGNVKRKDNIYVGDIVDVEKSYDKYMIENVHTRKNSLIRPPVANIDKLVIVVAIKDPEPDYTLIDKQIILARSKDIEPILCINKMDLESNETKKYIEEVYGSLGIKIIYTSIKKDTGFDELLKVIDGSISAFSGNSGVGKSSITKKITKDLDINIGELGIKNNKGKHTTKAINLYKLYRDTYILDTPGFSNYELYDIKYKELKKYYDEFENIKCNFDDCNHILEKSNICKIKEKVEAKEIDIGRYERYVSIYIKLKEIDDKKYK